MKCKNLVAVFLIGAIGLMSCSNANAVSTEKQKNELVDVVETAIDFKNLATETQSNFETSVIDLSVSNDFYFSVVDLDDEIDVFEIDNKLVIRLKNIVSIESIVSNKAPKKLNRQPYKDDIPIITKVDAINNSPGLKAINLNFGNNYLTQL